MPTTPPAQLADELLRSLTAALRSAQLYSAGHPIIARNIEELSAAIQQFHGLQATVVVGFVGDEVIVNDRPIPETGNLTLVVRRLKQLGVERISIDRGVTGGEVAEFINALTGTDRIRSDEGPSLPSLPHIRAGRVTTEQRVASDVGDMATIRRLYTDAVSAAETVWDSAQTEQQPDATAARTMIDGLAHAVSQNRTALLALTALKNYDNYTFTHMVNVSILTMGQARGLGVDGSLLREFGLAALLHDIGKVRTPPEILNKPEKLTDAEFVIMRRHAVEGAEMLRQTPDIPTLVPVVAFEHHLRIDGTGYPAVSRTSLNLGTMLSSIADVYDAMRSQRSYQQAFPPDRILEVLKRSDGQQFDRHLIRRFVQLVGIYPAGNLVKLNTGEVAVVLRAYAPDPYRPQVRVLFDRAGGRLDLPSDLNLWEANAAQGGPSSIIMPLDPADYRVDPLALM
jgi:putative nucleotidyltransferase with HDIG domain